MKKLFFYSLLALMCCFSTTVRADELTVGNGTKTNSYAPFWSGSADSYQRVQIIYEASELAAMSGSQIYQMTFYLNKDLATKWGGAQFKVSLAEVAETDFGTVDASVAFNGAALTQVYFSSFTVAGSELVIEFTEPYEYKGGNLLLEVYLFHQGSNVTASFYGINTENPGAIHCVLGTDGFSSDITEVDSYSWGKSRFIPKTTFAYGEKSTCTKPSGLIAYSITSNSARIGWTTEAVESYTLEYKKLGANSWTVFENASNGTTLSGLDEYSTYLVRLKKDCGEEVSQYATTSFFTPCAPKTAEELPYEYGFEDVSTGDIPTCWYKIANGNYPSVQKTSAYGGTAYEGDNYLYLRGGTPVTNCIVILPTIDAPYSELALSFWYKNGDIGEKYGKAQIGYMTNRDYASTFVSIQDLDQVSEYTHVENVSLASIPSNAYLAIRIGGATNSSRLFLDNVVISSSTPTCGKPTGLKASTIKDVSASISWEKGAATSSVLEYKLSDAESWTVVEDAVSPYALSGLTASSTYDVRVKNKCDEIGESGYVTIQFTTLCEIFQADAEHPYSENFEEVETGKIPDCWDNSEASSGGFKWALGKGRSGATKDNGMYFSNWKYLTNGYYNLLKTKTIYINTAATLSFYYKNQYNAGFEVWYSIDGEAPQLLDNSFTAQEDWTLYSKALPAACTKNDVQIIFKGIVTGEAPESDEKYQLLLDDLLIECEETCPKPTITNVGVSGGSVEVEWDKGGDETEWLYICQPKSVELVNWANATTTTSQSVELTDLEALTEYVFYLRAKCSEEDQSVAVSAPFETGCVGAFKSISTGFEASEGYSKGDYPECWTKLYLDGTPENEPAISDLDGAATGTQYLRVSGEKRQLIILPLFENEIKDLKISFKYKTYYANVYVGTMSDPAVPSTFTMLSGVSITSSTEYKYVTVDPTVLSKAQAGNHYLAFFYFTANKTSYFCLDDLVVEPACLAPSALAVVSGPTDKSVDLNWTVNGKEEAWGLQYSTDGSVWSDIIPVETRPYTLSGLKSSTDYYVRIKAVCGEDESSDWSNVLQFKTSVPTSVENVESNVSAQKLMIDGQLYILHNGKIYTMQGQRVK